MWATQELITPPPRYNPPPCTFNQTAILLPRGGGVFSMLFGPSDLPPPQGGDCKGGVGGISMGGGGGQGSKKAHQSRPGTFWSTGFFTSGLLVILALDVFALLATFMPLCTTLFECLCHRIRLNSMYSCTASNLIQVLPLCSASHCIKAAVIFKQGGQTLPVPIGFWGWVLWRLILINSLKRTGVVHVVHPLYPAPPPHTTACTTTALCIRCLALVVLTSVLGGVFALRATLIVTFLDSVPKFTITQ